MTGEFIEKIVVDMLGLFTEYVVAKGLSLWSLPATIATFMVKTATEGILLSKDWNDRGSLMALAVANFVLGLIAIKTSIAKTFIDILMGMISGGAMSALYLIYNGAITLAAPIQYVRTYADWAELALDILFGISALVRYQHLAGS